MNGEVKMKNDVLKRKCENIVTLTSCFLYKNGFVQNGHIKCFPLYIYIHLYKIQNPASSFSKIHSHTSFINCESFMIFFIINFLLFKISLLASIFDVKCYSSMILYFSKKLGYFCLIPCAGYG